MKNKKLKKLIEPTEPREFTEYELEMVRAIPYRKFLTTTPKRIERAKWVITLLEMNGANKKGCRLPIQLLGKWIGGNQIAQDVLAGFIEAGIVVRDNEYNADLGLARSYQMTDRWKLVNLKAFVRVREGETKFCWTCLTHLPLTDFGKNKTKKDGLTSMCKTCKKEYDRVRYTNSLSANNY